MSTTIKKSEVTEFQRAAAVVAFDSCAKTMATKELIKVIYNKVHGIEGNDESVSQLKLILSGNSTHYDQLWRSEEISTLDPNQSSATQRVLVDIYSSSQGVRQLVAYNNLTLELSQRATLKSEIKVTGSTLLNQALDVIKNGK